MLVRAYCQRREAEYSRTDQVDYRNGPFTRTQSTSAQNTKGAVHSTLVQGETETAGLQKVVYSSLKNIE